MLPTDWGVHLRCAQCADAPTGPGSPGHYPDEAAAVDAAMAAGWVVAPDGRLWCCSACGPILTCEAEGHEFTGWRRVLPAPGELARTCRCDPAGPVHLLGSIDCGRAYRYCRRCCVHESATTPTRVGVA